MPNVQMPDGSVVQLPEGMSNDDMNNALQQHMDYQSGNSSVTGFIKRQAGLVGRAAVEGATALPTAIANVPAFVANNTMVKPYNWLTGGNAHQVDYVNPFSEGMTALGAPEPQGKWENREMAILKPAFGVATGGAAAAAPTDATIAGESLPNLPAAFGKNMPLQYQAAEGGSMAGEAAKENGASPGWQLAAGLAGSILAPTAISGAKGVIGALTPLTDSGKDAIAGKAITSLASDPQAAAASLANAPEYVPGSPMTAGTASGDTGLIKLERSLNASDPNSDVAIAQNKARLDYLQGLAGTEKDIADKVAAREAATKPLYDLSGAVHIDPTSMNPVLSKIDSAISALGEDSDAGKELVSMRNKLLNALPSKPAQPSINAMLGMPESQPAPQLMPSSPLVQIYKETRDNLSKQAQAPGAYGSTVKGVIQPINAMLGQTLEQQNPLLAQANNLFRQHSIPINQMQNMQDILSGVQTTGQDANGNFFLSPAKMARVVQKGEINTDRGWVPLEKALSPEQYQAITNVQKDMARSTLANSPAFKPVGSDTYSNLASNNAISAATGGSQAAHIPLLGKILPYDKANAAIVQRMRDILQDPEKTRQILETTQPNVPQPLLPQIGRNLGTAANAGLIYGGY